jgi:hypothetical protein
VTLVCLGGEQYTGKLCKTKQEAQNSAANAAIAAKGGDPELTLARKKQKKQYNSDLPVDLNPPTKNWRNVLKNFCCKLHDRNFLTGDMDFNSVEVEPGQHQSTVKLGFLNGEEFTGELKPNQNEANQSAADVALHGPEGVEAQIEALNAERASAE